MTDDRAILAVLDDGFSAIAAGDADRAVAGYAPDVVAYELQPPLAFTGDEARDPEGLRSWFATWQAPPVIVLHKPRVEIEGSLAVVYGFANMRGRKTDEADIDLWYRATFVLRGGDVGWRVIHTHTSVPFRMDGSEKAALDLRP
jgi:ketosteroid isomerase-like protein